MNAEYLAWFAILIAVGVAVVTYLAVGPVPEVDEADGSDAADEADAADAEIDGSDAADAADAETNAAADDHGGAAGQSSPVSTTVPNPETPSSSDTP